MRHLTKVVWVCSMSQSGSHPARTLSNSTQPCRVQQLKHWGCRLISSIIDPHVSSACERAAVVASVDLDKTSAATAATIHMLMCMLRHRPAGDRLGHLLAACCMPTGLGACAGSTLHSPNWFELQASATTMPHASAVQASGHVECVQQPSPAFPPAASLLGSPSTRPTRPYVHTSLTSHLCNAVVLVALFPHSKHQHTKPNRATATSTTAHQQPQQQPSRTWMGWSTRSTAGSGSR